MAIPHEFKPSRSLDWTCRDVQQTFGLSWPLFPIICILLSKFIFNLHVALHLVQQIFSFLFAYIVDLCVGFKMIFSPGFTMHSTRPRQEAIDIFWWSTRDSLRSSSFKFWFEYSSRTQIFLVQEVPFVSTWGLNSFLIVVKTRLDFMTTDGDSVLTGMVMNYAVEIFTCLSCSSKHTFVTITFGINTCFQRAADAKCWRTASSSVGKIPWMHLWIHTIQIKILFSRFRMTSRQTIN